MLNEKEYYHYQTAFVLDKTHFSECFDQSSDPTLTLKKFYKAIFLFVAGLILLTIDHDNHYISFFVLLLRVLDALSVRYQKPWWLMRQMISKSANGTITLVIDQQGIMTESTYVNHLIKWQDINELKETELGLLVWVGEQSSYLSNSYLADHAREYIMTQIELNQ